MKPWHKTLLGLALALASAGFLILSFSSKPYGLLIWISFVPMLVGQYCLLPPRAASLSPAIAIGLWLGILLVPIFGGKSLLMVSLPLAAGVIVYLTDRGKRAFHENTGFRWFVLEGVVGWVGLEMIRSLIPAIGTWLFVGYPLWKYPAILQPLSIFGIYGLDLLIMGCNYAVGLAVIRWLRIKPDDGQIRVSGVLVSRSISLVGVLLAIWMGISYATVHGDLEEGQIVRAAAIQPNLPRAAHRDDLATAEERLAILGEMSREAAEKGAELIVWPEMALGFDPRLAHTEALRSLARETGAYLVIGYVVEAQSGFRNEAIVLTPSGEFLAPYGKTHPMITSGEPKSVLAGRYPVYETGLGKLGIMICFDAHFTDVARALSRQGVQLIANPALFGASIANLPHTQVVFRAIENRTAIVMADVAFNSAVVNPDGRIMESVITPEGEAAILVTDVAPGSGETFYARHGDWLGWISLVGLMGFAIRMNWKKPNRTLERFEEIAEMKNSYPPIGRLVEVENRHLHLFETGQGEPTVILESGGGGWSLDWHLVQTELAKFCRVCAYDRAGFGWSEPGPLPRTSQQMALELHAGLRAGGISGPYILVGASFGGHVVRLFADLYPDEVVGMVLVDARHADIDARMPPAWKKIESAGKGMYQGMLVAAKMGALKTVGKMMGSKADPPMLAKLPPAMREMYLEVGFQPGYFQANLDELAAVAESDRQVRESTALGNLPITVIRHGVPEMFASMPAEQAAKAEQVWQELQAELAGLANNNRTLVADHSGHRIQMDQPEIVVEAVREMAARIR